MVLKEDEPSPGISTTTTDQVPDPGKVVNINQDKLAKVKPKTIMDAVKELEEIDKQRESLNDQAQEIRSRMKNLGIPTAAFNAAYARYKKSPDKRAEQDAGYAKCCNAMGVGYQPGLFTD